MSRNNNRPPRAPRKTKGQTGQRFYQYMQFKLLFLFFALLVAFSILVVRLYMINRDNGEEYKKQVLSQQAYDSRELPFKRGTITDAKGTILANSQLVYNVIIDSYQMNSGTKDETTGRSKFIAPTLDAAESLGIDRAEIEQYVTEHPDSRYYVAKKHLPYDEYTAYQKTLSDAADKVAQIRKAITDEQSGDNDEAKIADLRSQLDAARKANEKYELIQGIWFEPAYIRNYPEKTLAADVIGFANNANMGNFGLEEYYNNVLNGTPGREYGYLNDTSQLERTTIEAVDGNNLVLTMDANIQSIVEKYLKKFNEAHENKVRPGYGANNVGCIIQDVKNGNILAMASTPTYDLSNPYDLSRIVGMPKLNKVDQPEQDEQGHTQYMTQEDVDALVTQEQKTRYLNALWSNFPITSYYESGSTAKPFTLAAGLESGAMTGDETYYCGGSLVVDGWTIKCHNTKGDGMLTVDQAIGRSCNVALMQMAAQIGKENFTKFQRIFNFGLKTNIDLADEARTDDLLIDVDRMTNSDLATNSFGQNFDVTMIQMITGFSSLINGGNYYEPHVVSKITSPSGATVKNIEPRLLKKTVSEETSKKLREATLEVVEGAGGTGTSARPAGYRIGGKTGTAETLKRGNNEYIVSFLGYAPYDDPQIAIYVVIDRMNDSPQDQTREACLLVHDILTEVLPYMNIYMTEPLSEAEEEELKKLDLENTYAYGVSTTPVAIKNNWDSDGDGVNDAIDANDDGTADTTLDTNDDGVTDAVDTDGDGSANLWDTDNDGKVDTDINPHPKDEIDKPWTAYSVDPTTGYYIDPASGHLVDPETGYVFGEATMGSGSSVAGSTPQGVIDAENGTRDGNENGIPDGQEIGTEAGSDAGANGEAGNAAPAENGANGEAGNAGANAAGNDTANAAANGAEGNGAGGNGEAGAAPAGQNVTPEGNATNDTGTVNSANAANGTGAANGIGAANVAPAGNRAGGNASNIDANGNGIADSIEGQLLGN